MKKILRALSLILTLVMLFSITVFAQEYNGDGQDGLDPNKDHGVYEGISSSRSGYLIWLSDGSGKSINGVVACATADGKEPYTKTGAPLAKVLITRFNENVTKYSDLPVPWGTPPFTEAPKIQQGTVVEKEVTPEQEVNKGRIFAPAIPDFSISKADPYVNLFSPEENAGNYLLKYQFVETATGKVIYESDYLEGGFKYSVDFGSLLDVGEYDVTVNFRKRLKRNRII